MSVPSSDPHGGSSSVAITSLRPGAHLSTLHRLEGTWVLKCEYSRATRSASFMLASKLPQEIGLQIQVQLKGEWAKEAMKQLDKQSGLMRTLVLEAQGGVVDYRPFKGKEKKLHVPDGERLRISFEKGLTGAWRTVEGRKVDAFSFKGTRIPLPLTFFISVTH
jgi:hypothetical protein